MVSQPHWNPVEEKGESGPVLYGDGTSPLECSESSRAEDDVVPGSWHWGSGSDRELHAFMNTGEDQLQTGSSGETQQMPSDKEQLLSPQNCRYIEWNGGKTLEEVCGA